MTDDLYQEAAAQQLRDLGLLVPRPGARAAIEVYQYDLLAGGTIVWNVTLAQHYIAQGRSLALEEVPHAQMAHVAATYDYDRAHVAEVDPTVPGIAAPLLEEGQVQYVVIDGIHRMVQAYQADMPFRVHVLSDADARTCVIIAPEGVIP